MLDLKSALIASTTAGVLMLAALNPVLAPETTVSGTLVDVAKYVTGDSEAGPLNMPGMMANMGTMMPKTGTAMSPHHPSDTGQSGAMGSQGKSMGTGMSGGVMMMEACHATLGIVTSSGDVYLLFANPAAPMGALALCSRLGKRVTASGSLYVRGGFAGCFSAISQSECGCHVVISAQQMRGDTTIDRKIELTKLQVRN